ncbi:MAG: ABC transporter ATP-binding protein [Lachnospiraceae bacterium]|nr:ABC transporter ATP-binding protein [Lachnospiraceae bacterium]MCI7594760.1 ABC transporter ATP-binding protein [Lachnospiraceae bacterium]MDD7050348.1 ABC transporter ATP-binding protein [Lachnospiraceae bacterium]MDY3222457.1 ABC transporter ATP-binding protein [Lachnospiraceae bacterium]MDY4097774.1 ABC transporter ATP-binding protein [Lachnospiraceae bacterium]
MEDLIMINGLSYSYGKGHGKNALQNVQLGLSAGKVIGILGPNGSGKTTLIKLLNGLLVPTEGEILIDGHNPGKYTKGVVSYLPERTYLQAGKTVGQMLEYFSDFYQDFSVERARVMLESLGIKESEPLKTLSKGTREKIQLILVMSREAKVYILDEPIAGVDPAARDYIIRTIIQNYNEDAVVLLATHLIADVEAILDEVIFIKDGRIVLQSTVEDIREQQGKSVDAYFREVFVC